MNWFRFGNPESLFLLWIGLPILILLLLFGLRMKRDAMLLFQSNVNPTHLKRHKVQVVLLMLGYLFVVIAIAQPQWGVKPETVDEKLDVMVALDISTSMLAIDNNNSVRRLTYAQNVILSLLEELEGDRVGLLYFAEASIVVYPLASDISTLRDFLAAMTPETLVHSSTRIGNAIKVATARFVSDRRELTTKDNSSGQKVLILFTDGEDFGDDAVAAAKAAKKDGVHIYCVGVGSSEKPVPIPLPVESAGYKRNVNGQLVLTALNEVGLREIAKAGNGNYYHANAGIAQLTTDLARLEKQQFRVRADGEYQERFQWFVGLAMILLVVELLIQKWLNRKGG